MTNENYSNSKLTNHVDVVSKELNDLVNQIRFKLTLKGIPNMTITQILVRLTDHITKESFLNDIRNLLKNEGFSEEKITQTQNDLKVLLHRNNFRWNFNAFDLYNLKINNSCEDNISIS
jgi:outer membrane protein assembly factor BamA